MAMDISAVGAKIVFSGGLNLTISEFSDEGTPFECSDVDVSTNAKNLNGTMISSRTPSVYPFSVTVIPGCEADVRLRSFLSQNAIQPGNNEASTATWIDTVTVTMPNSVASANAYSTTNDQSSNIASANEVTFTKVRIKSGPTGPSTSAEGRMSARTYNFEAEGFTVS